MKNDHILNIVRVNNDKIKPIWYYINNIKDTICERLKEKYSIY